jgi:hypothetical protein
MQQQYPHPETGGAKLVVELLLSNLDFPQHA